MKMLKKRNDEASIWISTTDLMSGLLVIFLFIAILMTLDASQKEIKLQEYKDMSNKANQELDRSINKAFTSSELARYNLNTGIVGHASFKDAEAKFDPGEATIKPEFKAELRVFLPKYIKAIYACDHNSIKEIRIEGHTSSEWHKTTNPEEAYINNMMLSQSRTRAILNLTLEMEELKPYRKFIKSRLTANGLSSSHLIYKPDGTEDKEASRRIEFKVVANDSEILEKIKKL